MWSTIPAPSKSPPNRHEAKAYFRKIRELNEQNGFPVSDEDLVFQRKQGMCNQRVFDSRLKKYCSPSHLNLPFAKSCHDVRRSFISHLFDMGLNPDEIRRIAGHENIEMTMRYCRGRSSLEELAEILEQDSRSRRAQQSVTRCNRKNVTLSARKPKKKRRERPFLGLSRQSKNNVR